MVSHTPFSNAKKTCRSGTTTLRQGDHRAAGSVSRYGDAAAREGRAQPDEEAAAGDARRHHGRARGGGAHLRIGPSHHGGGEGGGGGAG